MASRFHLALMVALAMVVAAFLPSARTADAQQFSVVVTSSQLNARTAPTTSAPVGAVLSSGDVVAVFDQVAGEEVFAGNDTWYQTRSGYYIYSGLTSVASGQGDISGGPSGRSIDVDLSSLTANAIENGNVVYTAYITAGTPEFPTPVGNFQILRRVFNETMDSSTIGIPSGAPGGYYLTDVLYTQYFTNGGAALHYNYWSPPEAFGNTAGSHGCIGMTLADSEFFWNFADVGTPVNIHW